MIPHITEVVTLEERTAVMAVELAMAVVVAVIEQL